MSKSLRAASLFGAASLVNFPLSASTSADIAQKLKVHIFSKHLQFLNYADLADAAASMGFDGIDLTVRPGGHVLPERVSDHLPKAAEAIRKAGLEPSLMTTAVDDASDPVDLKILSTAAQLGFTHYRMNWLPYPDNISMPEAIDRFTTTVKKIGEENRRLKLTGCYQNHAGLQVGSSIWEIYQVLREADKDYMGSQYDIRHAMVEGGTAWENGFRLIADRIKTITVKDYKWSQKNGIWGVEDVPLGEGMVDFKKYFGLLKKNGIQVPVTLHVEYSLGGAENGAKNISMDKNEVFRLMKKDLQKVHQLWQEA